MEFRNALDQANRILDEERRSPTVSYEPGESTAKPTTDPALEVMRVLSEGLRGMSAVTELQQARQQRPREVLEETRKYSFKSLNYNLLCALSAQLEERDRKFFIISLSSRVGMEPACGPAKSAAFPAWNGLVSELPLVAEFMFRNGAKEEFLRTVAEADPLPGHVLLMRHLEEMISLNFSLFTDAEYDSVAASVKNFMRIANDRLDKYSKGSQVFGRGNLSHINVMELFRELQASGAAILEQCRKAQYLYLKGSLLEGLNLEINQDRDVVQSYLVQLGFSKNLIESLNVAEQLYRSSGTVFDLKSCIGHLRSFLENLKKEAMLGAVAKYGGNPPKTWGEGLIYLRQYRVLTKAEEGFAAGLYTLMSDEAVHPLFADREYARLARNMVIEYGLLFLRKLEKLGLRPKPVA